MSETNEPEEQENPQDLSIDPNQEREYTSEELKQMRSQMKEFYETELPFLRLQEEYERLIASIEESKVKAHIARAQLGNIYLQQQQAAENAEKVSQEKTDAKEGDNEQLKAEKKPRKLKTDQ